VLFAWWFQAPLLIADTAWVSWTLHSTRALDGEFFLLYFFVLLLTTVGENLVMVVLGATLVCVVNVYASWGVRMWASPPLLRVAFLFTVALFYGHVLSRLKSERQRGDRNLLWARELETKVAERTAELERLYEKTRATSSAKSDFMASMSHELRTPLHIILGYADMLLEHAAPTQEEADVLVGHVRRAGAELLHLVDNVLEIGRLDAGRGRLQVRPVALASFVEELSRRDWIPTFPGVTVRWRVEPSSVEIQTDPGKLQIVLGNLITNAIKYTREGSIVMTVRDRPDVGRVEFEVRDTGPGIPPEQLARIHEPFHESRSSAHKLEGVGLGLAIVYGYAALLGVEVSVRSVVGDGTSFRLDVPYRYSPPDDRTAIVMAEHGGRPTTTC
jgi:signal transduction histidine kinase